MVRTAKSIRTHKIPVSAAGRTFHWLLCACCWTCARCSIRMHALTSFQGKVLAFCSFGVLMFFVCSVVRLWWLLCPFGFLDFILGRVFAVLVSVLMFCAGGCVWAWFDCFCGLPFVVLARRCAIVALMFIFCKLCLVSACLVGFVVWHVFVSNGLWVVVVLICVFCVQSCALSMFDLRVYCSHLFSADLWAIVVYLFMFCMFGGFWECCQHWGMDFRGIDRNCKNAWRSFEI